MRPRTATSWPCSRAHSRIEAFLARFECGGCEPLPPLERRRRPPPVPLRRAALTKGARASRSLPAFSSDSSTSYTRRSRPKVTVSEASDPSRSSTSLTRTVRATVRVRSEKCPCRPRSWSSRQRPSQPCPTRPVRPRRRPRGRLVTPSAVGRQSGEYRSNRPTSGVIAEVRCTRTRRSGLTPTGAGSTALARPTGTPRR